MNRNSKFFWFCTLAQQHLRNRNEISVCALVLSIIETLFYTILISIFTVLAFWFFGTVLGEIVGMIVTQTFETGIAYTFINIGGGFIIMIALMLTFLFVVTSVIAYIQKWWKSFLASSACKKIKIT